MGCDGGSIPKRSDLVKLKSRIPNSETLKKNDEDSGNNFGNWRTCALSKEALQKPVVACSKGHLYNKESVLKFLLHRQSTATRDKASAVAHVKSLKDVTTLKLTVNPNQQSGVPFICPITGREMNGRSKFLFVKDCGCVFSVAAFEELSSKLSRICINCGTNFKTQPVELNPHLSSDQADECKEDARKTSLLTPKISELSAKAPLQHFERLADCLQEVSKQVEDSSKKEPSRASQGRERISSAHGRAALLSQERQNFFKAIEATDFRRDPLNVIALAHQSSSNHQQISQNKNKNKKK
ncbi:unnamed protein product [Sphagnum compactum]